MYGYICLYRVMFYILPKPLQYAVAYVNKINTKSRQLTGCTRIGNNSRELTGIHKIMYRRQIVCTVYAWMVKMTIAKIA